jgi:alkyl hydroperoxide reductase subunit AhpC
MRKEREKEQDEEALRGILQGDAPRVGDAAPDFELPALIEGVRKKLRLGDFRGSKRVVLAFYPFNWQEVSAQQFASYQVQRSRVLASNAETVAVSVDSIMNTTAWERAIGPFEFPLCSDFWPHGEVSKRYGVLEEEGGDAGACRRAVIAVDLAGSIVFRKIYPPEQVPPLDEVLAVLESIGSTIA